MIYIVLLMAYLYYTIMYSSFTDYSVLTGDYKINFWSTWYQNNQTALIKSDAAIKKAEDKKN